MSRKKTEHQAQENTWHAFINRLVDRYLPPYALFLAGLLVVTMVLYSLFRLATLLYNRPSFSLTKPADMEILSAFLIGLRFDLLVTCMVLLIPFLVLTWSYFFTLRENLVHRLTRIFFVIAVLIAFAICAADLPYFHFFNSRFNRTALNIKNLPHSLGHIFREPSYYPMILVTILAVYGINQMVKRLWHKTHRDKRNNLKNKAISSCLLFCLLLAGIFGVNKPHRPDMVRSFFSTNGFYNQLALNPVHTFFDSFIKWDLPYIQLPKAINQVKKSLQVDDSETFLSPIAHRHQFQEKAKRMNVVLILMESMSADYMGCYEQKTAFTPGLDSLASTSLFFENCYSNGIHTNAGLFSSIYGMPIYMLEHPMLAPKAMAANFTGLPVTLKAEGYRTTFFCTHGKEFDNLDFFLKKNGYEHIHDIACYDQSLVVNTWGVPDETLCDHALTTLDSMAHDGTGKPFFATLLTITSHPPYELPPFTKFQPKSRDKRDQVYEYADWAISNFMKDCAKTDWYENTIFVLVGDHGLKLNDADEVPLSYNHVPLLIKAPGLIKKGKVMHGMANQTDIFPTVMGMLNLPYVQNTLGYDLLHESRPYAFFSQDEKLGVINDKFLYISRKSGHESITLYRENQGLDLSEQYKITKNEMRSYAAQMLQVSEWMIEKNLTRPMK
jgi:phosphoglycerol transferase MdoB-like AlkP superfamily enzyme